MGKQGLVEMEHQYWHEEVTLIMEDSVTVIMVAAQVVDMAAAAVEYQATTKDLRDLCQEQAPKASSSSATPEPKRRYIP